MSKVLPINQDVESLEPNMTLLRTPEPPYVAVISTNIHNGNDIEGYDQHMAVVVDIARSLPGFLGLESSASKLDDGRTLKVGVIYWQDMQSLEAWRAHPEHLKVKRQGKRDWYDEHNIRICQVVKHYGANLSQGYSTELANTDKLTDPANV